MLTEFTMSVNTLPHARKYQLHNFLKRHNYESSRINTYGKEYGFYKFETH